MSTQRNWCRRLRRASKKERAGYSQITTPKTKVSPLSTLGGDGQREALSIPACCEGHQRVSSEFVFGCIHPIPSKASSIAASNAVLNRRWRRVRCRRHSGRARWLQKETLTLLEAQPLDERAFVDCLVGKPNFVLHRSPLPKRGLRSLIVIGWLIGGQLTN